MEIILEAILTIAFSSMAVSGTAMFISFLIEDKKRTKHEEERLQVERERFENSMK